MTAGQNIAFLFIGAMLVYGGVLGIHAFRYRFGLGPFYALLGAITAIMSWVTDAGIQVEVGGVTFMVGSTVFYTAILLGVFVVYIFDGPASTRIAILTVAGVSIMMPLVAAALHLQMGMVETSAASVEVIPKPSLRINTASVVTTVADLLFLAVVWEFLGNPKLGAHLWFRAFLSLLGVMLLDVFLFNTGAFAGTSHYLSTMGGTLSSRLIIVVFAYPVLLLYLRWENKRIGDAIQNRPVLAIVKEATETRQELDRARQEIERRKKAEQEKEELIQELQSTLDHVRRVEGLLSMCSNCKRIRKEPTEEGQSQQWVPLENYVQTETSAEFSHGLCPDCLEELYPEMAEKMRERRQDSGASNE